jgi:hypothetical protein
MSKLTSLSEISDLADNAWINGSFRAIVTRTKASTGGKTPGRAVLVDPDNAAITTESCWWGRDPSPLEGKLVSFAGAGMKKTSYKDKAQVNVNEKSKIDVFQEAVAGQHMPHKAPAAVAASKPPVQGDFNEEMTKIGQTWLHSLRTALMVKELALLSFEYELSPEQFQSCVSSIFIEANRKGLGVNPPKLTPVGDVSSGDQQAAGDENGPF